MLQAFSDHRYLEVLPGRYEEIFAPQMVSTNIHPAANPASTPR